MNLEKGASDDDELRIRRSRKVLNTEDGADILSQHCISLQLLIDEGFDPQSSNDRAKVQMVQF